MYFSAHLKTISYPINDPYLVSKQDEFHTVIQTIPGHFNYEIQYKSQCRAGDVIQYVIPGEGVWRCVVCHYSTHETEQEARKSINKIKIENSNMGSLYHHFSLLLHGISSNSSIYCHIPKLTLDSYMSFLSQYSKAEQHDRANVSDRFLQSFSSIDLRAKYQRDKIIQEIMFNFKFAMEQGVHGVYGWFRANTDQEVSVQAPDSRAVLLSSSASAFTHTDQEVSVQAPDSRAVLLSSSASAFTSVCGSASQLQAPTQVLSESLEAPAPASPHH